MFTAQAYCQNLGRREGTKLGISYSQDFKVAYCKELPKQEDRDIRIVGGR